MKGNTGCLLQKGASRGGRGTGPNLNFTHQVVCPGMGLGAARWAPCSQSIEANSLEDTKYWAEMRRLCPDLGVGSMTVASSPTLLEDELDWGPSLDHTTLGPSPYLSKLRNSIFPKVG